MRILITSIVDPMNSAYSRVHALMNWLSKNNEITIVSARDRWKESQRSSQIHREQFADTLPNVNTVYLAGEDRTSMYHELFPRRSVRRLIAELPSLDFDVIIDYCTISMGYQVSLHLKEIPRVYDLADDVPDMIRNSARLPIPLNSAASLVAESRISRSLSDAIAITGTCAELLDRFCVPNEKRTVIPNGIPASFLQPLPPSEFIDSRQHPGEFLLGYVGVLREWLDIETVFAAMRRVDVPVRLLVIGEEGDRDKTLQEARRWGVEGQVTLVGTVPHDQIRRYLAPCDCGIIPFGQTETSQLAVPLKLFEYFSAGIPVVSTPIRAMMADFGDVLLIYESEAGLSQIIERVRKDSSDSRNRVEEALRRIRGRFTWEVIGRAYESLIECVTKRPPR